MLTGCFDDAKATTSETDTTTNTNNLNETPNIVEPTPQIPVIPDASCDPETVNLLDFEVWRREAGWWVGEYTLLGADGNPNTSNSWPYQYGHYRGFIHLEINGNALKQRNVFLYPPQSPVLCTDDDGSVVGNGLCGINGNEKIFSADQNASDCHGNLSGPYEAFGLVLSTHTQIIGDDTVLYQVRMPDGGLMQNQLTSLPVDGVRVRTAQGFYLNTPTYASYYRERKVTQEEFFELMEQTRQEYQILIEDQCARDSAGADSNLTCDEHFGLTP